MVESDCADAICSGLFVSISGSLIADLKFRIALPRPVAIPGRRLPPNSNNTIANTISSSQGPIPNMSIPSDLEPLAETNQTLKSVRAELERFLQSHGIDEAALDVRLILEKVLEKSTLDILIQPDCEVPTVAVEAAFALAKRRATSEPMAYVLNEKEFFGRSFYVDNRVLIPRPDTELLVEVALKILDTRHGASVVDVCCGSGCVGLSLASERPGLDVVLSDISADALEVAACNRDRLGLEQVQVHQGDLLEKWSGEEKLFDLIVANPPYVRLSQKPTLMADVREFEPALALFGRDEDGLYFHWALIEQARRLLKPNGALLLEIGFDQRPYLEALPNGYESVTFYKDLAGHDRVMALMLAGDREL